MSRKILSSLAVVALLLAGTLHAAETQGSNLPLKRVILFSSGVGFFENSGTVKDNAKVEMKFKVEQINDLLKSMVVQDLDGGQVSTVNYGSKDPITKTLKSFAVDLTENPTMAQLLGQMRGEKVVIKTSEDITGVILGVETHKKQIGENQFIDSEVLNLMTDDGLRSVPMESVSRLKLTNEKLDGELKKALALLATGHDADKKAVEISFLGKGERRVRVGYIQESPIWKTTYRLVLSNEKPLIQGWAIVENTSEEDWKDVTLSLVSGRPISFTMDLYQPLYMPRPLEELELHASLRPQVYGQDLEDLRRMASSTGASEGVLVAKKPAEGKASYGRAIPQKGGFGGGMGGAAGMGGMEAEAQEEGVLTERNLGNSVRSVANASEVGNFFQYLIDTPVTLPRQQSAMLPIVTGDVKAEKVSIYNQSVQAKHPLAGLKFTNTTGLYLMQGPITVFDGGAYAGDAKIEDLPPGTERLISYALDLDTEVALESKGRPEELLSVKLIKGTMITSRKFIRATEYTVKNSGKSAKTVLVEYPFDPQWKLTAPAKADEKTRNLYRFAVEAKPGEPTKLAVEEERTQQQQIAINNLDNNAIQYYLSAKVVGDKVKEALGEIVKRKNELQELKVKKQQLDQRIHDIGEDQSRIRQNMAQLDKSSEVHKNYVKKFSEQETEIEKTREQIATLNDQITGQRKSLDDYILGLDLQ
jgi:hypothetical protein